MAEPPELRLSDRDREEAAARLGHAYGEGRLTRAEFDERLAACYRAKTRGEIVALTQDLPVPPPAPLSLRDRMRRHARAYVGSLGTLWAIWAVIFATGGGAQDWWPLWVTAPWLVARFAGPRQRALNEGSATD